MGWLADLLLPALCPACRTAAGPAICGTCLQAMEPVHNPCPWCGAPREHGAQSCPRCHDGGLPNLRSVQVVGRYSGVLERLIGDAKAGARAPAVRSLAHLAAHSCDPPPKLTAVVPVPANPGRREGLHLATALAQAIAHQLQLPCRRLLRTTRTAAVQHNLPAHQRRQAVQGLFVSRQTVDHSILLVDDILTSGSTLSAAAKALRLGGAQRVYAFCLARSPRPGDPKAPAGSDEAEP